MSAYRIAGTPGPVASVGGMTREQADALALAFQPARYLEIDRLERYIDGSVYDNRPDFFNPAKETPLIERKPCVIYPVTEIAIGSHADLVLGEGRWPLIKVRKGKKATLTDEVKLSLETLIAEIVEQAGLRSSMREGLEAAMGERSVGFLCCVRRGRIGVELIESKSATVDRNADGDVIRVVIQYPYVEERFVPGVGRQFFSMLYRREIDAKRDVVFGPWQLRTERDVPTWTEDASKSSTHDLGFCPVVWYAFLPKKRTPTTNDGKAIHEALTDEIDAMNIGLSQRTRAAHYAGDPQMWETGVGEDENPAPAGRFAGATIVDQNGHTFFAARKSGTGRKKGAGIVWRYTSPDAKVGILTLPGEALKGLDDHCRDLIAKLEQSMRYVRIDPDKAKQGSDVSGRALELLYKPQVDFGSRVREDFGERGLQAVLSMLLRIALATEKKVAGSLYLDGLSELVGTLGGFVRTVATIGEVWMPPALDLAWGPMFADTTADISAKVTATTDAKRDHLISKKTAVQTVAPLFGVTDIEQELLDIDIENETEEEPNQTPSETPDSGEPANDTETKEAAE